MIREQQERTRMIMGEEALARLRSSRVLLFGVGGVGGYVLEGLARTGVGTIGVVDDDAVAVSNLNRQIIATHETVGQPKVEAAAARVAAIDPEIRVIPYRCFYLPEQADRFDFSSYDLIVDAIDTVTAKLDIIERAYKAGIPVVSAMGCGNRLDPTKLVLTDIYKTQNDPLARVMRRELKKRGVEKLTVVYSTEAPITPLPTAEEPGDHPRRSTPGSAVFVPASAGLLIASYVCRKLAGL